jgi:hypothetical protein
MAKQSRADYANLGALFGRMVQGLEHIWSPETQAAQERILQQLGRFVAHLGSAALRKFPPSGLRPRRCSMAGCTADGIVTCIGCGQPACLAHVHLSHRADGVCDQCVRDLLEKKGHAAPPEPGRCPTAQQIRAARRTLGVRPGASWDEVRMAHRRKAAENHPDRASTEGERKRLERKAKRINEAFDTLRAAHERKAA